MGLIAPLRVPDASRSAVAGAWLVAAFWNAIAWTTAAVAGRELRDWRLAVVALFPIVGVGLLVWAVRVTLHRRKFGTSVLELPGGAGVTGHGLAGTVLIPAGLPAAAPFTVTLRRIVRRTSGSGRNRDASESIAWEERSVAAARSDGRSVHVPFAFRIPASEIPSGTGDTAHATVLWRVEVSADVPGVDYRASFEVPVVGATEAGPLAAEHDVAALPPAPDPALYRPSRDSRIQVSSNQRGTEIVYPAARNPGAAASLTAFFALWCGAIVAMIALGAPVFFPIVFGLFGALLLVGVLELWLGVTRVVVDRGTVAVTSGLLGGGRTRTIGAAGIADVTVAIGMQAGGTPYYDVRIVRTNGRKLVAGSGMRDKREAEWLAYTIRTALTGSKPD